MKAFAAWIEPGRDSPLRTGLPPDLRRGRLPAPVAAGYTGRTAIDPGFALTGPALTLAEKLCARAAGAAVVRAGEIVTAAVSPTMTCAAFIGSLAKGKG